LCFDGHLYVFIVISNTSGFLALSTKYVAEIFHITSTTWEIRGKKKFLSLLPTH